ncbi:N-acetylmuramoyl-L-alanine amidase family protein [Brevibacillus brevis]|nr:N-acetylmuramoyl-L-alanine amidase [Brevibacillus brevis]
MKELKGKKIVIDPGHGGIHPGKTYEGRQEKDVTLKMSKILEELLEAEGAKVYLTRTRDEDFGGTDADDDIMKRVKYINKKYKGKGIDVLVSIHVNTERAFNRIGAFYQEGAKASKTLAKNIAVNMGKNSFEDDLAILRETTVAGAKSLIEIAQIDEEWLDDSDRLKDVANEIAMGLNDYFHDLRLGRV